jgi:hypothetical protein
MSVPMHMGGSCFDIENMAKMNRFFKESIDKRKIYG